MSRCYLITAIWLWRFEFERERGARAGGQLRLDGKDKQDLQGTNDCETKGPNLVDEGAIGDRLCVLCTLVVSFLGEWQLGAS